MQLEKIHLTPIRLIKIGLTKIRFGLDVAEQWFQTRDGAVYVEIGGVFVKYLKYAVAWTEDKFILTEPTGTNIIPYSDDISQWMDAGGKTITGYTSGIYGDMVPVYEFDNHAFGVSLTIPLVESTASVYIKANQNGTLGLRDPGSGSPGTYTNINVTTEWKRFETTAIPIITVFTFLIEGRINQGFLNPGLEISIAAGQYESTSFVTSPIPTDGAPATRATVEEAGTKRELTANELGLWRGFASGITLETGTLTITGHYEIIATTADYFGAGLVVGDRFTAASALALSASNSVQLVDPIRMQVDTQWVPGADWDYIPPIGQFVNILSLRKASSDLLYGFMSGTTGGSIRSYTGTGAYPQLRIDWQSNTLYSLSVRCGNENDMLQPNGDPLTGLATGNWFQIGVDGVWGTPSVFTGHWPVDIDVDGKAWVYLSYNIPAFSIQIKPPTFTGPHLERLIIDGEPAFDVDENPLFVSVL